MRDTCCLLGTISGTTPASVTVFGISLPFCSNIHLFIHIQYIFLGYFIRFICVFGDGRRRTTAKVKLKLSTAVFPIPYASNLLVNRIADASSVLYSHSGHCGISDPLRPTIRRKSDAKTGHMSPEVASTAVLPPYVSKSLILYSFLFLVCYLKGARALRNTCFLLYSI